MDYRIDLTGQRFCKVIVIGFHDKVRNASRWKCKCDCGKEFVAYSATLRSGKTKSCGCRTGEIAKETMTTHGLSDTRLHIIWIQMRGRCEKPKNDAYKDYGGRGIKVCDEWAYFINFYHWAMANGYKDGLSLDRIDNDGNYSPSNCRWANQKQQCRNTRRNRAITFNNKTLCMAEWSEISGVPYDTLRARIDKLGWSFEDAISKPIRRRQL